MDQRSKTYLQELVEMEVGALNYPQKEFLFGRRGYLTHDQLEKFKPALDEVQKNNLDKLAREKTGDDVKEEEAVANNDFAKVKKEAKELGIDIKGKSKDELELEISTIKGPAR